MHSRSTNSKGLIAVTPRSLSRAGHPALAALEQAGYQVIFPTPGRQPTVDEIKAFLPACVGYLAGVEPITAEILARCPQLRVISRNGVGVDNIDLQAARALGIAVERASGANARGVAELAIALMLAGLRHIPQSNSKLKSGNWARQQGIEICGRTLGVIGCGQIGKLVARMALGLDMRVRAYDPYPDMAFVPQGDFSYSPLNEILTQADVISLHAPPGEKPLVDAATIAQMKDGAFLINTARAGLVDEQALLVALQANKLRGYATDVYPHEPPELTPLLRHERVILMPHAGGFTEESIERATQAAVSNLLKVLTQTTLT
jgi:D-3-phosphoglycerate dehydrogenase